MMTSYTLHYQFIRTNQRSLHALARCFHSSYMRSFLPRRNYYAKTTHSIYAAVLN